MSGIPTDSSVAAFLGEMVKFLRVQIHVNRLNNSCAAKPFMEATLHAI